MHSKKITIILVFNSLVCSVLFADSITLKETKSDNGKRYLEFVIPKSESAGTYKLWNLTQNKQVGASITKTGTEASDLIRLEGNPGDKYTILDSQGLVVATYVDQLGTVAIATEISGTPNKTVKGNKKATSKKSNVLKRLNTSDEDSAEDQVAYIRALTASQQDVVNQIRFKLKNAKEKLKFLLKKKADTDLVSTCATTKMGADNKTMAVTANCTDVNQLSTADATATTNLEKAKAYEKEVVQELKAEAPVAVVSTGAVSASVSASLSCPKVTAREYTQKGLFSSYMVPGKGLDDEISVPSADKRTDPNSTLWSKKGTNPEAYTQKDTFLDRCNPWEPKEYSSYSVALSSYKKVKGFRRADFSCLNGVTKPARFTVDPFRSYFSHEGDQLITCPSYEGYDYKNTCWPPDSSKFEKFLPGEIYTQDLFNVYGHEVSGAPVKRTSDVSRDISEMEVYSRVYCKVGEKIFLVSRTPLVECGRGYVGQGNDIYFDNSAFIKKMAGSPFGFATYEQALANYKECSEYKIDIKKSYDGDTYKKYDGLFTATESNEEFKVEEHIGFGKISISSLYRNAHYKSLVAKNEQGVFVGKGVDYPGSCLEVVPFDQVIDRVSNDELKVTHTVTEDSCTFKTGDKFVMTLKRK
ncbi:MAG: hypothetical protein K2Q18_02885 [Bdellovibrionales bacterium]|nr:hypothetical protein [Bdellovibrionales bacterium]